MLRVTPQSTADRYRKAAALRSEGRTLREIGEGFGVSPERARQMIAKAQRIEAGQVEVLDDAEYERRKKELSARNQQARKQTASRPQVISPPAEASQSASWKHVIARINKRFDDTS